MPSSLGFFMPSLPELIIVIIPWIFLGLISLAIYGAVRAIGSVSKGFRDTKTSIDEIRDSLRHLSDNVDKLQRKE